MIYTSYFAKLRSLPKNIVPIAICSKVPDWYDGLHYRKLAPDYNSFMEWKRSHDDGKFIKNYADNVLFQLNQDDVIKELTVLAQGQDIALICYESPTNFCHRHIAAEWLSLSGYKVKEFNEIEYREAIFTHDGILKIHHVKCLDTYFKDVWDGVKTFELRLNDRNYNKDDLVYLQETKQGMYTGRAVFVKISYVLKDVPDYGLDKDCCIFGWNEVLQIDHSDRGITRSLLKF